MYRLVTGGLALVTLARVMSAQASSSIDLGTAILDQPAIGSGSVLTAAGLLSYLTPRNELGASAVAARTPNDLYTGQAIVSATRYASPFQRMRWELAASGSGFGVSGDAPSFGWQLLAREHLGLGSGGLFAGASGGSVGQSGVWRRILGAHAGGFFRLGGSAADELSGALAYTDAAPPAGFGDRVRYTDLFGYWQHNGGPAELLIGGGARSRIGGSLGTSGWASVTGTFWATPHLAIVVSGGRALEDVARAVPSVRYLSLALRVGQRSAGSTIPMPVHRDVADRNDGYLEVHISDDSTRVLTLRADSASTVELMADFTDWEPIGLVKLPNGLWSLSRAITPGVHHVAIRIDGGAWRAPPNLTKAPDEFGGEVGLLAVP